MDLAEVVRRLEVESLYADYAACLDADRLEEWPEFFTEDCHYRVTSAENYKAGLPLGLIYASSKAMLQDRVSALRQANIYEPQRYRHLISGIRIERRPIPVPLSGEDGVWSDDALDLSASFLVVRTMQDGGMILFAAGRYLDRAIRTEAGWKFVSKIVLLDSRQIDTLLAIPL